VRGWACIAPAARNPARVRDQITPISPKLVLISNIDREPLLVLLRCSNGRFALRARQLHSGTYQ
jgi:hypothetical protein